MSCETNIREVSNTMKIKEISYPTKWSNTLNDNIDVFVTLENGREYCVTVASVGWVNERVKKDGYLSSYADIIISEFSDENIAKALEDFAADDAYWLRVYSMSHGDEIPE